MASTNKTEHLGLNAWEETDRPQRTDFNADNSIIDTKLGEHLSNSDVHLAYEEKMWLKRPYAELSYTGNGNDTRMVTLPLVAKLVIIAREGYPMSIYEGSVNKVCGAVLSRDGFSTGGAEFNSMGALTVRESSADNGIKYSLNQSGVTYRVVAFR
ncbi:MAG: hypothetical protein Q4D44_02700 [Eubacteriales bacterium]|nr:hypothetical protein [Eubacteriales bacterium]